MDEKRDAVCVDMARAKNMGPLDLGFGLVSSFLTSGLSVGLSLPFCVFLHGGKQHSAFGFSIVLPFCTMFCLAINELTTVTILVHPWCISQTY